MNKALNLSKYLNDAIEHIISDALKSSLKNPKETAFILKYIATNKKAKKIRNSFIENGDSIPPFLIASITTSCNLFCKGCYARANESCGEQVHGNIMSPEQWLEVFNQAKEIGVAFILLAGGEPLMNRDVIEKASSIKEIAFPIFTNGTLINDNYIQLFDRNRNLIPILSIEGNEYQTDDRRGNGTYNKLMGVMDKLNHNGIFYGASVTVTTENIDTVTSSDFINTLYNKGSKVLFFVEYVPVNAETKHLAPTDVERSTLEDRQNSLRMEYENMIFLSFPGDEKHTGGCLAGGRGFFHINAKGGAEPCPFSPYSDTNLKDVTLIEALKSPFFKKLRNSELLAGEHTGGCLLFEKEKEVKELL